MKQPKISPAQRQVFLNLSRGLPAASHCRTQSDHGGFTATLRAMVKRGWLTWEGELTDAGKQLLEAIR